MWPFKKKLNPDPNENIKKIPTANGQAYNKFKEEENLKYFNKILKNPRDKEIQKRLLLILNNENNLLKKIHIVEKVDKNGIEAVQYYENRTKFIHPLKINKRIERYSFESPFKIDFNESFDAIFKEKPQSFTGFLFNDWKKIGLFGKINKVLKSNIFKIRYELTPEITQFWNVELKAVFHFIEEPIFILIEEGWTVLTKKQYNIVVQLKELISYYFNNELLILSNNLTKEFYVKMYPFMRLFFNLTANPANKEILLDGMVQFFKNIRFFSSVFRKIVASIEKLLETKEAGINLKNILYAFYMGYFKRYLNPNKINQIFHISPIDDSEFQCANRINEKINIFKKAKKEELELLERDNFITNSLNFDNDELGMFNFYKELFFLHQSNLLNNETDDKKSIFNTTRDLIEYDLLSFILIVCNKFCKLADSTLTGLVSIKNFKEKITLFDPMVFKSRLDIIKSDIEQISSIKKKYSNMMITYDTYSKYVNKIKPSFTFSDIEIKFFDLLYLTGTNFFDLSVLLNQKISETLNRDKEIPFENKIITHPEYYNSLTITEVLSRTQTQTLAISYILMDEMLLSQIKQSSTIKSRINELKNILKRIG